jgi:hypothetical protein
MAEYESDSELISFWSIEQIVKENLLYKSELALFADFLIHSQFWGFKFENTETSSVFIDYFNDEVGLEKIANSVEEFIDLYLDNPDNVFWKK